ncbi:MAG: ATPase, T2SS/T4P/T4SS family [Tepidisphaeraceae bacterium]|jgi:type II secretory ATPase GspE/PulE/Tfp pilus assembly ATPase PilB-like protein
MSVAALAAVQMGGYVNPWKALAILVVLIVWVRLLSWIDKDAPEARLPREMVNSLMMGALVGGYLLFFFLPGFGLAFGVLIGLFVVDVGAYLGMRSRTIGLGDLRQQFADWWGGLLKREKKQVKAVAGQVMIMNQSGAIEAAPPSDTPESLQYESAQQFLTKPLRLGAERLELVAGEPTAVSYMVDGMRYHGDAMDRNKAGAAVQFLKSVAGLDMEERRKPQTGTFKSAIDGKKYTIQVTSFGSAQGESMRLITNPKDRQDFKLDSMGFSEEQLKTVRELVAGGGGVILLGAPRGQGLTSLCYGMIRAHDAFLYHVHTIERAPEFDLEGVTQNALAANAPPAEEAKQVNWVVSQEPDVLMATSLEDPHSAADLAQFAAGERRVYVGLRAGTALDALRQWRKLVGDDALAMKNLRAIVVGRLVRRLCSACKVGYTPDPTTLRKLNMNPDVVGKLYQARKEPMRDAKGNPVPCTFCNDLAFKGRLGIYEVMVIDDEIRSVIAGGGTDSQIRQAQRGKRGRLLQEMALAQVQAGETSVEEVLRVLKPDSESGGSSRPKSGAGPAPASGRPAPRGAAPAPRSAASPAPRERSSQPRRAEP